MKQHGFLFALVGLFLCGLVSVSARHECDWDNVDETGLNAGEAGYTLVRIETFLELDNIRIFRPQEL